MDSIHTLVDKLYNNRLPSDLVPARDLILVFDSCGKRTELSCHKFILSIRSLRFNKMLKEDKDLESIKINDVDINTFRMVLRYMYCDEVYFDCRHLASHIQASAIYSVLGLKTKLIDLALNSLSIENSLVLYDQLSRIDADEIADYSIFDDVQDSISMHTFLAFKTRYLVDISKEAIVKLLKSDLLFIGEYDLFKAIQEWILVKHPANYAAQCNEFKTIKHLIRFPLMSKEQFDKVRKSEKHLFNEVELMEFDQYYATKPKKSSKKNSFLDASKKFSVNYNLNPRDGSLIVRVIYDKKRKDYIMANPYKHINDDSLNENYVKYPTRDEFFLAAIMKTNFGKDYNKNCLIKPKKSKIKVISKEKIYLFKMQIHCSDDDHNQGMAMEYYKDGKKVNISNTVKDYSKGGDHFISFDPPIELKMGIHYRILFRNEENYSFGIVFEVENIFKETDEGDQLDIQLKVDNDETDRKSIGDLFFFYKT